MDKTRSCYRNSFRLDEVLSLRAFTLRFIELTGKHQLFQQIFPAAFSILENDASLI